MGGMVMSDLAELRGAQLEHQVATATGMRIYGARA